MVIRPPIGTTLVNPEAEKSHENSSYCRGPATNCQLVVFQNNGENNKKELLIEGFKFGFYISYAAPPPSTIRFMICCNENSLSNLWECETQVGFQNSTDVQTIVFNCYNNSVELDYGNRGHATVNVTIKVIRTHGKIPEPFFDFEEPGFSDVTFLIGSKKVYAHRSVLSVNSPYFSTMFLSNFAEKKMEEILLEETVFEEFVELLNAVYPSNCEITDKNFKFLLKLGDMYQIDSVIDKCESFIKSNHQIDLLQKLEYADKYSLSNLESFCLERIKTEKDLLALLPSSQNPKDGKRSLQELGQFDEKMQLKILEHWAKMSMPSCEANFLKSPAINTMKKKETTEKLLEDWRDIVLKIENVEVLVNRAYLSIHSPVFRELLYEKREEGHVELDGIKCNDFLELLSFINDPNKPILLETFNELLHLAHVFQVSSLMSRIEKFLMGIATELIQADDYDTNRSILQLAEAYVLSDLQDFALKLLEQKTSRLQDIIADPEFVELGAKTRLALLRCCFMTSPLRQTDRFKGPFNVPK